MRQLALAALLVACGTEPTTAPVPVPAPVPEPVADEPAFLAAVRDDLARAEHEPLTFDHVAGLTDASGPRLAGSEGDRRAVAWATAHLTALGLSNVRAEPVTVPVWERGEGELRVTAPVPQTLPVAALGGSVPTAESGIEAEVVRAESVEALAAMNPATVAGRIVFIDRRMERARDGHGYGDAIGSRIHGASAAARLGAAAVIIRSVGTDDTRFPHTGVMRYADDAPQIPAAAISNADADVLARWIEGGTPVRLSLRLTCRDAGEAQSANVVGEVVGSEHPEQIVLLGAHLDSWDLGRGAVDDGSGVAIVIEAARQLLGARTPPLRTVRVVLFAAEENSGAGADAYREAHEAELAHHVLAAEADFGDGAVYAVHLPGDPATSPMWARLASLLSPLEVAHEAGVPHGGADVEDLGPLGVPLLDLQQDGSRYFDLHHTANDVLTEVDRDSLDRAMRAFLAVASWASRDPDLTANRAPSPPPL